ncbi:MAG: LysM peptidoglycan-binding domain-containing protein, partial [Ekhidna sp.]
QTGETLYTIATKIGVKSDSLRKWNELNSNYLKIGQQLYYMPASDTIDDSIVKRGKSRTQIDDDGFERVFEEGVASVIESMETSRFLALHRSLPIGTNLEVRNLMNNQVVHVKVVGRLPKTGLNRNLLIRVSQAAYDQLRILDPKSRVEVSYFK